jgi:hypothetical protein
MVVKNLIHYLINKYLKNYVERLDYENLKLNLKNGLHRFFFYLPIFPFNFIHRKCFTGRSSFET